MARPPRLIRDDGIYHIINRRVGRLELFDESGDFEAFEKVLAEAQARRPSVKVLAYILMKQKGGQVPLLDTVAPIPILIRHGRGT